MNVTVVDGYGRTIDRNCGLYCYANGSTITITFIHAFKDNSGQTDTASVAVSTVPNPYTTSTMFNPFYDRDGDGNSATSFSTIFNFVFTLMSIIFLKSILQNLL
uniref:Uncharacterized protein n=1 Tax=Panagrolaimus sp. PS1159 TaxID=55785 RepID=A0AC35FJT9_9BILA